MPAEPNAPHDQNVEDEVSPLLGLRIHGDVGRVINLIHHATRSGSSFRVVLSSLGLGVLVLLQAMNMSMLTTTQDKIAEELLAFESMTWFTSAYLITMSALTPISGKLSSIFPPRWCIFVSGLLLALGCAVSAQAAHPTTLILGRIISGVGASGALTVSTIVVLELSGPKKRGLAMGALNSGLTLGVASGAAIAGTILPHQGWRALFYLQIPVAIGAAILILLTLPAGFHGNEENGIDIEPQGVLRRLVRIDYFGAMSLALSIFLLLYSLSAPGEIPILPMALSPLAFAVFICNEIYFAVDPIIPMRLIRSRGMVMTCLATGGYMMARWSVLFYTPTYAMALHAWSRPLAGSMLLPTNLGFAVGGLLVGALHIRRNGAFYWPSIIVLTLNPCTLAALALLATERSPAWAFITAVFLNGAVSGAALNYTLAHLLHITPKDTHYVATALMATFRGFAGSFGSAIGGGLFLRRLRASLEAGFQNEGLRPEPGLITRLLSSPEAVSSLPVKQHTIAVKGYEDALHFLWLMAAGLAALMILFQAATGHQSADEQFFDDPEGSEVNHS